MIRTFLKVNDQFTVLEGLPPAAQTSDALWLEVNAATAEETAALREQHGVEVQPPVGNVVEDGANLYMRSLLAMLGADGQPRFAPVAFALTGTVVVTLSAEADFHPFGPALQRCHRRPANAESAKAMLRILLQTANDAASAVVDHVALALDGAMQEISAISDGYNEQGQELGVSDLSGILSQLNDLEELILRCIESQLTLARTVRHLGGEVDDRTEADLQVLVTELAGDVAGTKEHAAFEHEKLRYLQSAVTNILNIKQNQIVKVFTIITAVFLPPTLVGTFYGMNFAVMPELSWEHGFIYSMILTLCAALLPLYYIKRRGWLR